MTPKLLLLLAASLWMTGCASLAQPPGRGVKLGYTRSTVGGVGGTVSRGAMAPGQQSVTRTRQAVLGATDEVEGSTGTLAGSLSRLAVRREGIGGVNGAFTRYVTYGATQARWIDGALGGVTLLADVAGDVAEPDMEWALLRMSGPRLQAAMSGALLLAAWLDFLHLADVVLQQYRFYSGEKLFMDMNRVQKLLEPSMTALASMEPGQVEAVARSLPGVMERLTHEFQTIREGVRMATERGGQFMAAAQLVEMLTLVSTLKLSLSRLPSAAPATHGAGLVMGSGGVMMGSQVVVSSDWVEMMRRLVQAGVLSASAVSAAVRIHAGGLMMAQAHDELPKGVREALGDGPEVRAMHETGKAGAGMSEPPKHHVLPQEFREWFEQRGFTGAMDIDQFCVRLEAAKHQAIHGGGNWRLGRTWPGEWNRMIMKALKRAETRAGRMLTRDEVLRLVAKEMRRYKIPMDFTRGSK
jgi:hypothetical protein